MPSPRVSGARLDPLIQQALEPAFGLNAEFRIVWVNRAWEELTGHAAADVIGLPCHPHGPTRAGDLAGLGGSLYPPPEVRDGRPASARTLLLHPSGERRWRRVEYWPFRSEKGGLGLVLGVIRDQDDPALANDSAAHRLRVELMEVRDRLYTRYGLDALIGRGPAHRRVLEQVAAAAATTCGVLIVGEPGTGKRHIARTIHLSGPGRQSPLVPLDCAALPPEILERVLFGPADDPSAPRRTLLPRIGLAEGATMLVGDVIDLPRDLQARLVEALDGRIRLIATTSHDPEEELRHERLRADLYFALTTVVIRVPPLRERLDEFPLLAQALLERANLRGGRQRAGFTSDALRTLASYDWPGNLRELARTVDDAQARGEGDLIDTPDLPACVRGHLASAYLPPPSAPTSAPLDDLLTQVERRLIESALQRARQNKSRAADLLSISRPRLYRRIKELGIPDEGDNGDEPPSTADTPPPAP